MSIPPGVITVQVAALPSTAGAVRTASITAIPSRDLVWTPTGQHLSSMCTTFPAMGWVLLPAVDQDGFVAAGTTDAVMGWSYLINATWTEADGTHRVENGIIQVFKNQTSVFLTDWNSELVVPPDYRVSYVRTVNGLEPDDHGNVHVSAVVTSTGITDSSAVGRSILTAADSQTARASIGAGTYTKPSTGIPALDLGATVQASLARADGAVPRGELMVNVRDHGALGDGVADDTAAITAAYTAAAGRPLYFPAGTYPVTTLPDLADGSRLIGEGPLRSEIRYSGTDTLLTLTGKQDIAFRSLGIHLSGAGATAITLSGCFQIALDDVRIRGAHTSATGATYRNQTGLRLVANTGNTRIHNTVLANLGVGLQTDAIQNEITNSKVVNCYNGIKGAGAGNSSGLAAVATEFIADGATTTAAHVVIEGVGATWIFESCWFEGSDYGLIVGTLGVGGPSSFAMIGCKIGAKSVGIQLNRCRQPSLIACEFNEDQGTMMTELVFAAGGDEAIEGFAANLVTTLRPDFSDADFPQYWNVLRRGQARFPNLRSSSNLSVAGTTTTGSLRVTNGAGAARVLTSDAEGNASWQTPGSGGGTAPDATSTVKGLVQLAGDFGGTAAAPTVPALVNKADAARQIIAGTGLSGGGSLVADRTLAVVYGTAAATACAGDDPRLSNTRAPTGGTVACDFVWVAQTGTRTTGVGDLAAGMYVGRPFTLTKAIYQFDSADGGGSSTVELRRNGAQVPNSNLSVTATSQVDNTTTDAARTAAINISYAVGDRLALALTAPGTTPGKGLRAYLFGTWD
ncbi:hypothetical protein F5X71_34540 [Nocardia brasiliensis]|uniref:Rhamnogalacturonase A/B/Epimerase-like pectate lyase domain-containing protein n=1 Tax=Nocardia brasiliensis TaxID=37326 RepID=A0A6G9Y0V0_NOCBR|nr:glycosyl hydrolase family 28-related protein [Nocardia brasiliensis]QIS06746.1 hypothetical protein F5X71_34540 [Nocardia brasiliensis]